MPEKFQQTVFESDDVTVDDSQYLNDKIKLNVKQAPFSTMFSSKIFKNRINYLPQDMWKGLNELRSYVSSSLNLGLRDIILKYAETDSTILEIGSGIGYNISSEFFRALIKTQKSTKECQLLSELTKETIYQMSINDIYKSLKRNESTIPLILALNVFDTLLSDVRKKSLLQISKIQNVGDRLLIMLDTNPYLDATFEKLKNVYPEYTAIPYFPGSEKSNKVLALLVPLKLHSFNFSLGDLCVLMQAEAREVIGGCISEMQKLLKKLLENHDLQVIDFEDFFIQQMRKELEETGYKTNIFYHTSFTTGKFDMPMTKDILYKSVTATPPFKQYFVEDKFFVNTLKKKGIQLPAKSLKSEGCKIFGAEILVIEATKGSNLISV